MRTLSVCNVIQAFCKEVTLRSFMVLVPAAAAAVVVVVVVVTLFEGHN